MNARRAIGIIGGTGPEGRGLATRFAAAGERVIIGSRDEQRGREAAEKVARAIAGVSSGQTGTYVIPGVVEGAANSEAAHNADLVVLAVPYEGQAGVLVEIAGELTGKIAVNVISPLAFVGGRARPAPPPSGSAAEEAAAAAPGACWVAGFHTLPARDLLRPEIVLDTDALICGDDDSARREVMALAARVPGLRPVDAGALESARCLEAATALLININRIHRAHGSLRVVGIQASLT